MFLWYAVALATLAWATSVLTFGFGLYFEAAHDVKHMVDVVGGLASAFLWFAAAFGATSLQDVGSGVVVTEPAAGVAYLFGGFGIFMAVVALIGTGFLLDVTDLAREDFR